MLESLPILQWSRNYGYGPKPIVNLGDVPDLPEGVHERIRSFIKTEVPCSHCTHHLCSCSGGSRSEIILLPGERTWIEQRVGKEFRGQDPTRFPLAGDCTQLSGTMCSAGYYKPFDCISFPFQPVVVGEELVPFFAKNCSFHPADLHPQWILERWKAWQYIFGLIPEWVKLYAAISPGERVDGQ